MFVFPLHTKSQFPIGSLFLLLVLIGLTQFSIAQDQPHQESNDQLFLELKTADSLLFGIGFNQCQLTIFEQLVADDFEFYHDQSGITPSKEAFIAGFEKNICQLAYKPFRKVKPNSLEVFPLKNQGEIYGAIQKGVHEFYAIEEGKKPYLTSTAKFTHLWIKDGKEWKLKRVLSYDHQTPK